MEEKTQSKKDRSSLDLSLIKTQDLLATEKLLCTQDFDDTQLVDESQHVSIHSVDSSVTEHLSQTEELTQSEELSHTEDFSETEISREGSLCSDTVGLLKKDQIEISNNNVNPLKDVSNLPRKSTLPLSLKSEVSNDFESSKTSKKTVQCTDDLPDTEELVPSQRSILVPEDLTPELPGVSRATNDEVTKKEEVVESGVSLSQLSGSSENPESTPSGSNPSSSQLSSSDGSQSNNRLTPTKPKIAQDLNLDVTQDLFFSEDAGLGETSLSPQKTASQEDRKKKTRGVFYPPILTPSEVCEKEKEDQRLFKVPQKSGSPSEDGKTSKQGRSSRERISRRRAMNDVAKASPPLDSQDVNLRMTGSSSDTDTDRYLGDADHVPAVKTPELQNMQVGNTTPECLALPIINTERKTVELMKNLLVNAQIQINCKIQADPKTGDVISLQILDIGKLYTEAQQLEKISMFGRITPKTALLQHTGTTSSDNCPTDTNKSEAWEVVLVNRFQDSLKRTLITGFKEEGSQNSLQENQTLQLGGPPSTPMKSVLPVTSILPVTSVKNHRKRKLSSTSPAKEGISIDKVSEECMPSSHNDTEESTRTASSPSPFKRPRVRRQSIEREKIQTPKRKPLLSLPSSSSTSSSEFSHLKDSIPIEAKVFAQWVDKKFYPADVLKQTGPVTYRVRFHDAKEKELPSNKICVVNTFEINQPVLALSSAVYEKGVVAEVKAYDYMDDEYVVKLDNDSRLLELPRDKLSLTENMVQSFKEKTSGSDCSRRGLQDIDLGNVLHGKRTRSTASPCPLPGPSGLKSKVTISESSSCDEIEKADNCSKVTGVETEENNVDPLAGKGPLKTKGRKKASIPEDEGWLNEYGPIPEDGSNLFAGLTFILTCASKHDHEAKERRANKAGSFTCEHSDVDNFSEGECYCGSYARIKKTMSKSRLAEQLTAGGGRILTNLDGLEAEAVHDDIFVIANRPCQTAVFIHCLALGIKGVLFDAVIHCCKKGLNFKEYTDKYKILMDTGYSIKEKRLIPWNEFRAKPLKPFKDRTIHVYSKNRTFVNYWEKILSCAGASVLKLKNLSEVVFFTIIIAEPPVDDALRSVARESTIPIVSTEWIKQSLIHNEALPARWHADFRIDSEDSD